MEGRVVECQTSVARSLCFNLDLLAVNVSCFDVFCLCNVDKDRLPKSSVSMSDKNALEESRSTTPAKEWAMSRTSSHCRGPLIE